MTYYGKNGLGSIYGRGRDFSIRHHVQTVSTAHPTYPVSTRFEEAGAWS
jgi:hypothetical protein